MTTSSGWWYRASQEQKLRQIDAGIELGMTAREVAICSGVDQQKSTVKAFARIHGRRFFSQDSQERGQRAMKRKGNYRRAFWQGDRDLSDAAVARRGDAQPDYAEVTFE